MRRIKLFFSVFVFLIILLLLLFLGITQAKVTDSLQCNTCRQTLREIERRLSDSDREMMLTYGHRLDGQGEYR